MLKWPVELQRPHQTLLGAEAHGPHSQSRLRRPVELIKTALDTARSGGLRARLQESADAAGRASKDRTRHYC